MKGPEMGFETQLIHAGELPLVDRAVTLPIFQTSTFEYGGEGDYHEVRYLRLNNNPNQVAVCNKISALEGTEKSVLMSSGMAAISTTLLSVLKPGDHLLAQEDLYGGARYFFDGDLTKWGVTVSYFPTEDLSVLPTLVRSETKAIYVESISNPMMRIPDLASVVQFAKNHSLLSIIDNTFCSPVLFRPAAMGFDLILHSATKYLNGHSDLLAGCVSGSQKTVSQILKGLNLMGAALDPHACFLLHRGLKTLGLRVRRQNETALELARFLASHKAVARVHYPGLLDHSSHAFAKEYFKGFGAMVAFELKGTGKQAEHCMRHMKLAKNAPSLGGVESLVTRPATTSHAGLSPEERQRQGIVDSLVRVSVGIEDFQDLADDFDQAFSN